MCGRTGLTSTMRGGLYLYRKEGGSEGVMMGFFLGMWMWMGIGIGLLLVYLDEAST